MLASRMERVVMVSFHLLFMPPHHFELLSQLLFPINLLYHQLCCPPLLVGKENKSSCCHPLLRCCMEKEVIVSSPLIDISPQFDTFLHSFSFQFNCCPMGHSSCPPSVNQGNKGLPPPSLPTSCVKKAVIVSFSACF